MAKRRVASLARQFSQLRSACQLLEKPNRTISRGQNGLQHQQQRPVTYMPGPGDGAARAVTLTPEDGIGPLLTGAVLEVVRAMHAPDYFETYEDFGKMWKFPEEDLESISKNKVCLKGGLATPVGGGVSSLNVQLRKELDLFASLVHYVNLSGLRTRHENVDIAVIRKNTEGEYSGLEHEVVPRVVESLELLKSGSLEGDDGKGQPPTSPRPLHGLTKEKLELRSQIVGNIVHTILNLEDATLVGNVLTEWLRKFVARVDIMSTLDNLSGQGGRPDSKYSTTRFVPYSQIARIVHAVMLELGRKVHLPAALEVLHWMESQGWCQLDPHIYTTIISALSEDGNFELAEKVFEGLENAKVKKDPALLNAMLNTRGKAGQIDSLEDLFESMKRSACKPDLITYNTVMNSYVQAGMGLGTVVDVFRDMYSQGIDPDLVSFNILLQACITGRHVKEAQKIFDNMKKRGLKPSVITYTTLITLYANTGQSTQALDILSDMLAENCHPNTRTFSSLITACGRDGNIEEAEKLFHAMGEFGLEPNVVTFNAMIDMYGKGGKTEMALQKFKELELAGLKPTDVTFSSLMSCLKAAEAYSEVISFYERAKMESMCNQHVFSEAIDTYIKWDKLQKVKDVQSDMVAVNCTPNVVICSIVLAALGSKCSSAEDAAVLVNFLQGVDSDLAVYTCRLLLKQMSSDEEVRNNISRLFLFFEKEDLKTCTVFTSALVDALWALGWYRRAALVVAWVMQVGVFEDICVMHPREWKLDLRRLSSGTALVALYQWFGHLVIIARHLENSKAINLEPVLIPPPIANKEDAADRQSGDSNTTMPVTVELLVPLLSGLSESLGCKDLKEPSGYDLGSEFPPLITIVTGWGKLSKQEGSSIVQTSVQKEILKLGAPFKPSLDSGRWMATGGVLIPWLMSPASAMRLALSDLAAEVDSPQ